MYRPEMTVLHCRVRDPVLFILSVILCACVSYAALYVHCAYMHVQHGEESASIFSVHQIWFDTALGLFMCEFLRIR